MTKGSAAHRTARIIYDGLRGFIKEFFIARRAGRDTSNSDGSAHVSPALMTTIGLAIGTALFTLLLYGWIIGAMQNSLRRGIESAPVIRNVLNASLGQPLMPMPGADVAREAEARRNSDYFWLDHHALGPAQWLEVLKRLGLAEADSSIAQFYGNTPSGRNVPIQMLIADLQEAAQGKSLGDLTALNLITSLAANIGGRNSNGQPNQIASACIAAAVSQVMAGFPGRWEILSNAVRMNPSDKEAKGYPALSAACPWMGEGWLATPPSFFSYSLHWKDVRPTDADLARIIFEALFVIDAKKFELPQPSQRPGDGYLKLMQTVTAANSPDVTRENSAAFQEKVLAEQFARQVIAAAMTTADVAQPKLWVDMLIGLPQAILNWFFLMLLVFVCVRSLLFWKLKLEIASAVYWLNKNPILAENATKPGANNARNIADTFETLHRNGGRLTDGLCGPGISDSSVKHSDWTKLLTFNFFRRQSLVALTVEKAVRRLIIGQAQPELFREFCATRRTMVDESAWLLRYLARALPALGFVGTILGILFALRGADGIVSATSQAERVAAMAAVTAPLAFAFSHTFIALVFGLITGFLVDRQTALERIALFSFEETLIEKIDSAEL